MKQFDIAIIGGGLVGTGLALALCPLGLSILLVDNRANPLVDKGSQDPRLFALNTSSSRLLNNIGIWQDLIPEATPIKEVHVSYQKHFGAMRFCAEEIAENQLGYMIPAKHIENAFADALKSSLNLTVLRPMSFKHLEDVNEKVYLTLENELQEQEVVSASLVFAADGIESTVRTALAFPTKVFDYYQSAIVTKTQLSRTHRHVAYERFCHDSTLVMLPLQNDQCATIWTVPTTTLSALLELSEEAFLEKLQEQFGYRLGRLQNITTRYSFPLKMIQSETQVIGAVCLIGNAAHSLHPVAAQGLNLSLYEVAVIQEVIHHAISQGQPLSRALLSTIDARIEQQRSLSTYTSHYLAKFFSKPSLLRDSLWPMGTLFLEHCSIFKRSFLKRMLGQKGQVPSLLMDSSML